MPFIKGESGNPAGRPLGARNKATLLNEALVDADGERLTRQLIDNAHAGNAAALRLCLDRVLPRGSDRPVLFALPRIESAEAAREAVGRITAAIGTGELTPREATDLLRVVERSARALAAAEAAARVRGEDSPEAVAARLAAIVDVLATPGEDEEGEQGGLSKQGEGAAAAPAVGGGAPRDSAPASAGSAAVDRPRGGGRNNGNNENNGNTMKQGRPAVPLAVHANGRMPEAPGVTQTHVPERNR